MNQIHFLHVQIINHWVVKMILFTIINMSSLCLMYIETEKFWLFL